MKPLRHEFLIRTVLDAVDTLKRNNDRSPENPVINTTLTNLVGTITALYSREEEQLVLGDPRILDVREELLEYLAQAEGEMEKYWTREFLSRDTLSQDDLKDFWYWDNYEKLVDKEMQKLPLSENGAATPLRAAFVGSGSLPLSAIIFHQKTGIPVTCIDNDPEACDKAEALFAALGIGDKLETQHVNGGDARYDSYDLVFIASLIPDDEKHNIIQQIRDMPHPCLVAVRSAERLHTLLYEPFAPDRDSAGQCRQLGKTDHDAEVINTTYIMHHDHANDTKRPPAAAAQDNNDRSGCENCSNRARCRATEKLAL